MTRAIRENGRGLALAGLVIVTSGAVRPRTADDGRLEIESRVTFRDLDGGPADLDGEQDGTLTVERLRIRKQGLLVLDEPRATLRVERELRMEDFGAIVAPPETGPARLTVEVGRELRMKDAARIVLDGSDGGGRLRICAHEEFRMEGSAAITADGLAPDAPGGSISLESNERIRIERRSRVSASGAGGGLVTVAACGSKPHAVRVEGSLEATGTTGGRIMVEARRSSLELESTAALYAFGADGDGSIQLHAASTITIGGASVAPSALESANDPSERACGCADSIEVQAFALLLDSTPAGGPTSSPFHLRAEAFEHDREIVRWNWDLGDGRQADGAEVTVSYPLPGTYFVSVTATDRSGATVSEGLPLVVGDPASPPTAPYDQPLPAVFGDVDGDGQLGVADAYRVLQHRESLDPILDPAALVAADFDFSRGVDHRDVDLIARAVMGGGRADLLHEERGAPGRLLHLTSHHLDDLTLSAELKVGSGMQLPVTRLVPGYGTSIVPFDASTGATEALLFVGGALVASYPFEIEELPAPSSVPGERLRETLAKADQARGLFLQRLQEFSDRLGLGPEERAVLSGMASWADEELSALDAEILALLEGLDELDPGVLGLLESVALANGLDETLLALDGVLGLDGSTEGQEVLAFSVEGFNPKVRELWELEQLASVIIAASSALSTTSDVVSTLAVLSGLCSLSVVALPICGPLAALLTTLSVTLAAATAPTAVFEAMAELVPKISETTAVLTPEFQQIPHGEVQAELHLFLRFPPGTTYCEEAGGKFEEKLLEIVVQKILKRVWGIKYLYRALKALPEKLESETKAEIESRILSIAQAALDNSTLKEKFDQIGRKLCEGLGLADNGVLLPLDPRVGLEFFPPEAGFLVPGIGIGAPIVFTCVPSGLIPGVKTIVTANVDVCGENKSAHAVIACIEVRPVTITMGDNGRLNDDIFLVKIEGESVLTSDVPVRSTSVVLELPIGIHQVQMFGLAAPDGVGTYFIRFDGVSAVIGDPLTGTDLTPGRAPKSWLINVNP